MVVVSEYGMDRHVCSWRAVYGREMEKFYLVLVITCTVSLSIVNYIIVTDIKAYDVKTKNLLRKSK